MISHQSLLSKSENQFHSRIQSFESWDFHFHKSFELLYVISGQVVCTVNNKTDVLREGEFAMCLSNEIHAGHSVGDTVFWTCFFSANFIRDFGKLVADKEGDGFKFRCGEPLLKYFESVFLKDAQADIFAKKACLYALCGEYLNQIHLTEKSKTKSGVVSEIVDFVSANYMNKIRLSDVSELLNYDYHYVSRLFKSLFNMSFNDFVNVYRLERATELLNEDKKLVDIAYESGFQSVRSFNESFKHYFGISPTEYKKRA